MNHRERTVLIFLILVLLTGVGVTTVRRARQRADLKTIAVASPLPTPYEKEGKSEGDSTPNSAVRTSGLINVNTATAAELDLLPGIGPVLAGRIIEYRTRKGPFKTAGDLIQVPGIGPKKLAAIQERITVQ